MLGPTCAGKMLAACQAMKPRSRSRRPVAPLAAAVEVKLESKLEVSKTCSRTAKSASLGKPKSPSTRGKLIGMKVRKLFSGAGYFNGRVVSLCGTGRCQIKYSDGGIEEMSIGGALRLQVRSKSRRKDLLPSSAWTDADDKRLLKLIQKHGAKNWQALASHFNKSKPVTARTASSLRHRYIAKHEAETNSETYSETNSGRSCSSWQQMDRP